MAELKTKKNPASVEEFLATVDDPRRREDAQALCEIMREVTKAEPVMWGTSIVGFGSYQYKYASGREGEWPAVGFSPRKQNLTVYISEGFDAHDDLLTRLGKHSTGRSCLYLKRLSDADESVLHELIKLGFDQLNGKTVVSAPS